MSESAPTYHITVTREDGLWVAVVRDLPAGTTDVERITDLETEVRDLIATLREVARTSSRSRGITSMQGTTSVD